MTLKQIIDEASNLGAETGLDAQVRAWFVGKPEEMSPLAILQVTHLSAGWDAANKCSIAELRIKP